MAISIDLHSSKNKFIERELTIKAGINNNDYVKEDYPVIHLSVRERGIISGEVTLFMDFEQVADLQFELGKLLEEYTKK